MTKYDWLVGVIIINKHVKRRILRALKMIRRSKDKRRKNLRFLRAVSSLTAVVLAVWPWSSQYLWVLFLSIPCNRFLLNVSS
uniref:Uncharacterized protein n=1 Tax=Tanacetum cinerariifolium TaxID=118510 RepID=A0A6L2LG31_TANCI|nr:hypothetical protein [Tanacetum cinerariifolium]